MSQIIATFDLATRLSAVVEHNLLRRFNLGFTLHQPFAWGLINAAAVLARMFDEHGFLASEMSSPAARDEILSSNMNVEAIDQMLIKCATLRNFNRRVSGSNDIGMGQIAVCLKTGDVHEVAVDLDAIKVQARDRVKAEIVTGRLRNQQEVVTARYKNLVSSMYDTATKRQAQMHRLMNEVFFICNAHDVMLFTSNFEQQLDANKVYADSQVTDFDQYGYLADGLAEKLVAPLTTARDELQKLMDRSYLQSTQVAGQALMDEINKIAKELGVNWSKMDAQRAGVDALFAMVDAESNAQTLDVDATLNSLDNALTDELKGAASNDKSARTLIKSDERKAREAAELEAAKQRADKKAIAQAETNDGPIPFTTA